MFGIYYKTISRNYESGETVFLITPKEACPYAVDGLVRCRGKIGIYTKGIPLELNGTYSDGEKTFIVTEETLTVHTKESTMDVIEYVAGNLTDAQKEKLCELSGNDLFSFIEKPGIADILLNNVFKGSKKAGRLAKSLIKNVKRLKEQEDFTKELMTYGIPIDRIESLLKKELTLDKLDKNPYSIMLKFDIPIDAVEVYACNRLKIKEYSVTRLCGFLYDALVYLSESGDTCCTMKKLVSTMNSRMKMHGAYPTVVDAALANLCIMSLEDEVFYREIDGVPYVYLAHIWNEETVAVANMRRLQTNIKEYDYNTVSIDDVQKRVGLTYNKEQLEVFNALRTGGVKVLTGPPGSGKTAVIRGLMEYFSANGNGNVKLAATTGMAAKVMSAACGAESQTANLMLNVRPFDNSIKGRDLNDPVDADLIIVDEVSMLGLQLFSVLVRAVNNGCILILVGDFDQLQSVDYGNVLHDLIDSGIVEVYRLTEILRQSGVICTNAQKINRGDHMLDYDDSFIANRYANPDELLKDLEEHFIKNEAQILCPIKSGDISTFSMNCMFQNPDNTFAASYGKKVFRIGDKIIMTKTNYDKNYINGSMGYVIGRNEDDSITVRLGDYDVCIDRQELRNMELADAITIHKSQGSEFDDIHIVLPDDAKHMMTKRILYTGVTRAKKHVRIYYMGDSLDYAIDGTAERERNTMLAKRLSAINEQDNAQFETKN